LIGVIRPDSRNAPALLSVLVEARLPVSQLSAPWDLRVLDVVEPVERSKLLRAQSAAALAAIGRGVYGALVEVMLEKKDGLPVSGRYRAQLQDMVAEHRAEAVKLDVSELSRDIPNLPSYLLTVLVETQRWLSRGQDAVMGLHEVYLHAEMRRKGRRSRLPDTLNGRRRRQESEPPTAYPLSYRWANVQRLLQDLEATGA
jgi:hypothetical protein